MSLLPMKSAPKDKEIVIKAKGLGMRRVYFVDCAWLRDEDPEVTDCWRTCKGENDIELSDALGWRPTQ